MGLPIGLGYAILRGKAVVGRPSIKLSGELVAPGWRNWQTQRTQNPPIARSWGFDPPSRHQYNKRLIVKMATQARSGHFYLVAVLVAVGF